jgi:predicted hydrolase (HD superfamily)
MPLSRSDALALMTEYTQSDSLRKHMLAVVAAVRGYARLFGEDEEDWGVVALLHDFDYERDPAGHPQNGKPILEQAGVPGNIVHAIQSHGDHTGVPRVTLMEKTLYAVDELTGFVTAVALVRPSNAVRDVDAPAVRRKMKDKAFARAVSRDMMLKGAEDLGTPFDDLVGEIVTALDRISDRLGLAGVAPRPSAATTYREGRRRRTITPTPPPPVPTRPANPQPPALGFNHHRSVNRYRPSA